MRTSEKTPMEIIREGLMMEHKPGSEESKPFINAIYGMMMEYGEYYRPEFDRMDDNEKMYLGDHWSQSPYESRKTEDVNMPKPSIPVINATVENLTADMVRDAPEVVLSPDWAGMAISAKVLTRVFNQDQKERHFIKDWTKIIHDFLVGGYCVFEAGYDKDMCNGNGMSFVGHQPIKNMMFDPCSPNIQDGRGVFKIVRRPDDWFLQRYPEQAQYMTPDEDIPLEVARSEDGSVPTHFDNQKRLVEFWVRVWDSSEERYKVHMVQLAGHQVLYNSAMSESRKDGYYRNGKYPFVVTPLFERAGTPLGYGIVDIFKDAQRYSDKLSQIILMNAFMSGDNRVLLGKGSGITVEAMSDWSKRVIEGQMVSDQYVRWMQPNPLPAYVWQYNRSIMSDIKQESGSNDQSRGQSGNSITAASAITALQEMATKRSRMESILLHDGFSAAAEMALDLKREFDEVPRKVPMTIGGHVYVFMYDRMKITPVSIDGEDVTEKQYESLVRVLKKDELEIENPIGYYVDVKTATQTIYQKMQTNELILSFMQKLQGAADVAILMEALQIDEIEEILDVVRRSQQGGVTMLTKQLEQAMQKIAEQNAMMQKYEQALASAQAAVDQSSKTQKAASQVLAQNRQQKEQQVQQQNQYQRQQQ